MTVKRVLSLVLFLALCFSPIVDSTAAPIIEHSSNQEEPPIIEISTGIAPTQDLNHSAINTLSGSNVTFDPTAGGDGCYDPGTLQTFCFKSESYTTDYEYVYNNWLKFPSDWIVSNVYVQGTPVCDAGSWGSFGWSFQTSPYEINIDHPRYQSTTDHCVATYCVDVTPAGTDDFAEMSWYFGGDGYGSAPHYPCSDDGYTPSGQNACDEMVNPLAAVPACVLTPKVVLTPEEIESSGCHGETQFHTMTITNDTGAASVFNITYEKNFPGDFSGPDQITLADGETTNFNIFLDPHLCSDDGDYLATVTVSDGTYSDQSTIHHNVYSELRQWQQISTNPVALMDNVLAGYASKIWSITGYGATSDVTTYDPVFGTWTTIAASAPPWAATGYPRSGCQMGNEVFVYGDSTTSGFTGLWSYNMDTNVWTAETPGGTPPSYTGIWAPSWVADTETGLCYLTGGSTAPGAGNLKTVFVYDVITNAWLLQMPAFTTDRDFHAAFLFNRPSDSHKLLCVAGGYNGAELNSSQCFDFSTGVWNAENADLGALPGDLWAMGYTQRMTPEGDQLWMVGGILNTYLADHTWYYDVSIGTWNDGGLLDSAPVYRTAAVTLDGTVYHVGGSTGSFSYTGLSDKFIEIICPDCIVPGLNKQATEVALPGQTIHYNITIDPMVNDDAFFTDTLSEDVEFVPGSLSVSPEIGDYGYSSSLRTIWWSYNPALTSAIGWSPAEKSGTTSTTYIATQSGEAATVVQTTSTTYSIDSVLWDQPLSAANQSAFVDQEFPDYPTYSSYLADDFQAVVPWLIDTIFIPGNGWNGFSTLFNATALTFMIYEDNGGLPAGDPSGGGAPPIWAYTLPPTDPQIIITNGYGGVPSNSQLVLDEPILIPSGHYWLIFYPTMPWAPGGQYGRHPADTTNGNTVKLINPGGGFGLGTIWQPWNVLGLSQTDMAFRIEGMEVPTLQIEFDAIVNAPLNQIIANEAFLDYGPLLIQASDDTFTGYGTYLPMLLK